MGQVWSAGSRAEREMGVMKRAPCVEGRLGVGGLDGVGEVEVVDVVDAVDADNLVAVDVTEDIVLGASQCRSICECDRVVLCDVEEFRYWKIKLFRNVRSLLEIAVGSCGVMIKPWSLRELKVERSVQCANNSLRSSKKGTQRRIMI